MKTMNRTILWQIALCLACGTGLSAAEPGLVVSHRARSLQPGEVVLVTVRSPKPVRELHGTAFGKRFSFYRGANPRTWRGLIGIDLETAPGRYPVRLRGFFLDGSATSAVHELRVRDKSFETRRLTVDEKYVTPPKELEERIAKEANRLTVLFATLNPERLWQGPFVPPVPVPANDNFGRRSILNGKPRSPHTGIDFPAEAGTEIHAPNSGRVVLADDLYFSGNTVVLDHGLGLYSFFGHLSRFSVHTGDRVQTGDVVGRVGSTGRSTGPHLHWTVRLMGTRVDPLSLIAALSSGQR
jgi:murein DD-endopeptidase MepM/ murein hydrolase activator NlpD